MIEWPLTNPLSTNVTSSLHNHERWKTSITDSKFRTTCHKPLNWKTCIQSPPKIFQSVVRNVECRDRLEGMDTASFGNLQKSPEYFRLWKKKVVEIFLGNADKMHTKVPLLWLTKREQFSVVLFALSLKKWVGRAFFRGKALGTRLNFIGEEIWPAIVSGIVTGVAPVNYWPIFFSVLSNNPRTLCESKLGWVSL